MTRRIPLIGALALLALAVLAAGGCGSSDEGGGGEPPPNYAKALAGAPPKLAALHAQENELLPGGQDAYEKRIAELRGYPIVANAWASWCGPCRYEFPALQELAARYGKRVAFIGINSEDSDREAARFLSQEPVPYPSYSDPDKDIHGSIGATGLPDTAFYDRRGELCYVKIGAYRDHAELEEDVREIASQDECESG